MTNRKQWEEIDHIFAAALELEVAARPAFLDEACAGDSELRKEVESLLAHDSPVSLVGSQAVEEATRLVAKAQSQEVQKKNIGPYQIIRPLGAGGMGHVYLAHDKRLNRPVAVKLLSYYDAAEEERIRRFRQEALAASALNHPNILTIYEIGEFEGHNFIATEFVDGQTLQALIEGSDVSVETAVEIAIQVASALSAAHAAGITHRDIKPANIMVRADGLVKVLDFGIAKFSQPDGAGQTTESLVETIPGTVIGTAAYMSPEQARGVPLDARSDIWSLGVILYEMVTGRRPFQGDTALDLMSAVIGSSPPSFSESGLVAPEPLERIIFRALEKDREARYQTATELLTDLKDLKGSLVRPQPSSVAGKPPATGNLSTPLHPGSEIERSTPSPFTTSLDDIQRRETQKEQALLDKPKTSRYWLLGGVLTLLLLVVVGLVYRSYDNRHPPIESIAVLPFKNESGSSDVEYLSDGMTDSLINSLSQLPHLSVKARSSVFRYKGKEIEPQRIASELSVQAILSGRVVQRGNDITLYLSLVDASNGDQLWGEQYDRKVSDLVSLQKEIARDVSQKLRARLSGSDQQKVTKDYTANADAYQLYLQGRYHVFKLTPPEVQRGISYFQQAIALDQNYALAYAGLSDAYRSLALGGEMLPTEFLPKSKAAAERAVEIDDTLAEAHAALGMSMFWYDWTWSAAEDQFKRALELNPNDAGAHLFYAHLLSNTGRHAEALAEVRRARELDPLSPFVKALEGQFLLHAGRTDEALASLRKALELEPNFWMPHLFASSAYIEKGMYPEAIAEALKARELSAAQTLSIAFDGYALAKSGKQAEARAVLDELLKLSAQRYVPSIHIALLYNGLGERDKTFEWLERAYQERDPKLTFLKVEPKWNNLRADPRFADLMKRMGF